jgi:hypothetical protein
MVLEVGYHVGSEGVGLGVAGTIGRSVGPGVKFGSGTIGEVTGATTGAETGFMIGTVIGALSLTVSKMQPLTARQMLVLVATSRQSKHTLNG